MTSNPEQDIKEGLLLPLVEDFYTIQGEGYHTGEPAYFIRLGGCDVGCNWCDAKMTWNPMVFPPVSVNDIVERASQCEAKAIVITGGEPLMYELGPLTGKLKEAGFEIFLETSGSHPLSGHFDWVCLSPKTRKHPLPEVLLTAHELKVIVESPDDLLWAERCAGEVAPGCLLYLQPEWSVYEEVIGTIVEYAKSNPKWNISVQTHKFMHIP